METKNLMERLADELGENATVKKVFGDSIETKNKTIIPVARVSFGLGGGQGQNKKDKDEAQTEDQEDENQNEANEHGSGGGGGVVIKPKGVYEITEEGSRFIPTHQTRKLLLAGIAGFAFSYLFFRKKRK